MLLGKMAKIIIDGKKINATDGTTVLTAAREHGIEIPTLCSHEALEQSGACRFCVVEIKKGKRSRIVTSCLYPVEEGLEVNTKSERVLSVRRLVLQLLMARNPASDVIRELAVKAGVSPEPSRKAVKREPSPRPRSSAAFWRKADHLPRQRMHSAHPRHTPSGELEEGDARHRPECLQDGAPPSL